MFPYNGLSCCIEFGLSTLQKSTLERNRSWYWEGISICPQVPLAGSQQCLWSRRKTVFPSLRKLIFLATEYELCTLFHLPLSHFRPNKSYWWPFQIPLFFLYLMCTNLEDIRVHWCFFMTIHLWFFFAYCCCLFDLWNILGILLEIFSPYKQIVPYWTKARYHQIGGEGVGQNDACCVSLLVACFRLLLNHWIKWEGNVMEHRSFWIHG